MYRFTAPQHNLLFGGLFPPAFDTATGSDRFTPPLDIVETATGYTVQVDLPGVKKENLSVNVKENILTIDAEPKDDGNASDGEGEARAIKRERRIGRMHRALRLGRAVDADNIRAEYNDGVLTLTVPHAAQLAAREIDIN